MTATDRNASQRDAKGRARQELTQERLKELLEYDPRTGVFRHRAMRSGVATPGMRAGSLKQHGYRAIHVDGARYYEHQLAYLYMTGEHPKVKIDHRDTDRANNAWLNLRLATDGQNSANRRMNKTSAIGLKGVCRHVNVNRVKRYGARIKVDRVSHHLGWFSTKEEAHLAYASAAIEVHGEFARF